MEQLAEFFSGIFSVDKWPARWFCGYWSDFHGWLYILSDLTIWLAYMTIPVILLVFIRKKEGIPLPKVFILFGAFILLCGFTHLIDAIIFWEPIYRFSALIRLLTALVSVGTVIALVKYFNEAVGLKTSKEFEFELNYRKQAMNELERSNKDLSQFAHIASHDLQSPLNTIKTYLTYLQKNYNEQLDDTAKKMVNTTVNASERMQKLINAILQFSQVGTKTKIEKVDLNQILKEIITDHGVELKKKNANINYSDLPVIHADYSEMSRILTNLISNAIKYQKAGNDPVVHIKGQDNKNNWKLSVTDNGIGMDNAHNNKIFQIFQRLHAKHEYEGTGIGLATVAKIIERYGGRIWYESEIGKGTTFYLIIPKEIKLITDYE